MASWSHSTSRKIPVTNIFFYNLPINCSTNDSLYASFFFSFCRIGRITGRLPKELADDVIGSLLDCFR